MAPLKVLIADDERPARQKVRRFLQEDAEVGAIFEATDGVMALTLIGESHPDLIFLDVQMPGLTGPEVIRALPRDATPHVVFVTAYDRYAVEAFDLSAVDYLLKPFDRERFQRALGRAKDAISSQERQEDLLRALRMMTERRSAPVDRLLVEDGDRTVIVPLSAVERFEADRNYVKLHVPPAVYRVRESMQLLEQKLDASRFARLGRGTIVNLDSIRELRPAGHGDSEVLLKSGARVRLSRRYRDRLDALRQL